MQEVRREKSDFYYTQAIKFLTYVTQIFGFLYFVFHLYAIIGLLGPRISFGYQIQYDTIVKQRLDSWNGWASISQLFVFLIIMYKRDLRIPGYLTPVGFFQAIRPKEYNFWSRVFKGAGYWIEELVFFSVKIFSIVFFVVLISLGLNVPFLTGGLISTNTIVLFCYLIAGAIIQLTFIGFFGALLDEVIGEY